MAINIVPPDSTRPIVEEDLTMEQVYREWARQVSNEVSYRSLIFGTGSPETVVEAEKGSEYMDESGTTGNIKYIKKLADIAGDKSQGWILV